MKQPQLNFYLPKAETDEQIALVIEYGDRYDSNSWSISDAKQYHLVHLLESTATGYGSITTIKNVKIRTGAPIQLLTFAEFKNLIYNKEKTSKELNSDNLPANLLTIDNIEKILLKYIGEEESEDIIKEIKLLS